LALQVSVVGRTPREPASGEVFQQLVDYLLRADSVRSGLKLPSERSLAEMFGVGRATVREALRTMEMLELIEVRPGDGTYVKSSGSTVLPRLFHWGLLVRQPDLLDLLETRREIELTMARRAAIRRDDRELAELATMLEKMRVARNEGDFVDADIGFHLLVSQMAAMPVLADFLTGIRSLLNSWMHRVVAVDDDHRARACEEHEPILRAIAGADPEAAVETMEAHLHKAQERLLQVLSPGDGSVEIAL
jgi:DNA-binding FadR family transcriptional regulator